MLKTVYEFTLSDKIKEVYDSLQTCGSANSESPKERTEEIHSNLNLSDNKDNQLSLYDEELKKIYRSKSNSFYVGRDSAKCAFVFDNLLIAHIHAQFIFENGRWHIRDNYASGGTTVNGIRLRANEKRALNVGDEIILATKKKLYVEKKLENKNANT